MVFMMLSKRVMVIEFYFIGSFWLVLKLENHHHYAKEAFNLIYYFKLCDLGQ